MKYTIGGIIIFLLVWHGIAVISNSFFLPTPQETIEAGIKMIDKIKSASTATIGRIVIAFGAAAAIGIPTGLLLGKAEKVYRNIEPCIDFLRSIPATALFPLFMIIFGIGDLSKIIVAGFGAVLIIIFNTASGVMNSGKARVAAAKIHGASIWQIFREVTFWESLPQTFVGLRIAISLTVAIVIVTEMFIGTNVGVGRMIIDAQVVFNIPGMFA
ncbi:MAG: ABC transporter permease subunit, partial [Nanoarchaeota archaeon]